MHFLLVSPANESALFSACRAWTGTSKRSERSLGTNELVMLSNHVHPRANRKKETRWFTRPTGAVNRLLIHEVASHCVFGQGRTSTERNPQVRTCLLSNFCQKFCHSQMESKYIFPYQKSSVVIAVVLDDMLIHYVMLLSLQSTPEVRKICGYIMLIDCDSNSNQQLNELFVRPPVFHLCFYDESTVAIHCRCLGVSFERAGTSRWQWWRICHGPMRATRP